MQEQAEPTFSDQRIFQRLTLKNYLTGWLTVSSSRTDSTIWLSLSAALLDSVFQFLADPTWRQISRGLASNERTVGEIARPHKMSLAAVSKHLKVLESAELIARKREREFSSREAQSKNAPTGGGMDQILFALLEPAIRQTREIPRRRRRMSTTQM